MIRKVLVIALLFAASSARAQQGVDALTITQFDPSSAVDPISSVEGPGVKIGEGTILHPVFGIETGFVSNVFYEENPTSAGVMRLLGQIGTSSLRGVRLNPNAPNVEDRDSVVDQGDFQYLADLRLAYDQPLSGNETVRASGGLGIGARLKAVVNPKNTLTFSVDENFVRLIRAANFETASNENRDINTLRLTMLVHPQGRSLSGYLYLQNTIDIFESDQAELLYPDRMDTRFGVHATWQWLPRTQLFADVSMGIIVGLGDSVASNAKNESFPLVARAGMATLLTPKTSFQASAGYTNGFYSNGPNFSAPFFEGSLRYRYSPFGRVAAGYEYIHNDSVNANFYRDHVFKGYIQQLFVPFAVMVQPEIRLRQYNGITIMGAPPTRDDLIIQVIAGSYYNFRNWLSVGLDYKFSTVQTNFTYVEATGQTVELDYIRHELLAGLRIAM